MAASGIRVVSAIWSASNYCLRRNSMRFSTPQRTVLILYQWVLPRV
jgi:hypothetical protein